ncbi:hypothetical protein ACTQ5K_22085 [Niallia sp. Sow4_A1]|jgi:hypothetical protein|uniref:Uncharacterized protein n=1 Tax=Niallia hominis TaxID=3133173 RepID=A0ABV1EWK2_9BACI|nr:MULTISPECIES: hypothetical protein [Bacillaceae]MCF2648438.1 hypothetical protein [Niallia circulans]MCM3364154.1 hypothetical protein [Niallia sp. MER TA 168]CAI9392085.1 hypothetical protein BACSP_03221 [Bacillus sp. T2.9-1]
MSNKSHTLNFGWNLIAHKDYKLFSNQNEYVLMDWDGDVVLCVAVQDHEIEVLRSNWNLHFKVNLAFKTIKVFNDPDEEE